MTTPEMKLAIKLSGVTSNPWNPHDPSPEVKFRLLWPATQEKLLQQARDILKGE
jgi:hypothetical protein